MDFDSLIKLKRERFDQLERDIADPALFSNRQRAKAIMRDHASIKQLLAKWDELEAARKQLDDNRELAMSGDVEIAAIADDEIPVFWACGVTPQSVINAAKLPFAITHSPGLMLVTDLKNRTMAVI